MLVGSCISICNSCKHGLPTVATLVVYTLLFCCIAGWYRLFYFFLEDLGVVGDTPAVRLVAPPGKSCWIAAVTSCSNIVRRSMALGEASMS